MDPVTGLSLGRIAVGTVALTRPDLAAQALKLDVDANPALPFMARLFGSREIALGLVTLLARGRGRRAVVLTGIAVDAADAAAGYLALSDRSVSKQAALGMIGPAGGAVVTGLLGLRRR